jgi:hypothetical protein
MRAGGVVINNQIGYIGRQGIAPRAAHDGRPASPKGAVRRAEQGLTPYTSYTSQPICAGRAR